MGENKYYVGTDLKFRLVITASGFDMHTDSYTVDIYCGKNKVATYTEGQMIYGGDNSYYLTIPTVKLMPGMLRAVVTANVPDTDFTSGYRREVCVIDLCYLKSVL